MMASAPHAVPQSITRAMVRAVQRAAEAGQPLQVDHETRSMLDAHPELRLTFAETRDALARIAMERRVPIEFG